MNSPKRQEYVNVRRFIESITINRGNVYHWISNCTSLSFFEIPRIEDHKATHTHTAAKRSFLFIMKLSLQTNNQKDHERNK